MNKLFGYALEKLHVAEHTLATHRGRIQERLIAAVGQGFGRVPAEALPDDLQELYEKIYSALTNVPPQGDESAFESTINEMDDDSAEEIAWSILELVKRAEEYHHENVN